MTGLYFLAPTLFAILISMLVVRAGAIALTMTGMAYSRAKFQALSAFTGTGFTTREAELVMHNPTRRAIVGWLMILGNAGIVAVIITATTSFVVSDAEIWPLSVVVLAVGVGLIYLVATRTGLIGKWETLIERHLGRYAMFEEGTVEELLHLMEGHGLVRLTIQADSPMSGQAVAETEIAKQGCLVLGVERGADWIATPTARTELKEADRLVIYGQLERLRTLPGPG